MISKWRDSYKEMYCNNSDEELSKQHWFNSEEEYSILFEKLYDQPSQRREYIESCLKEANPSWGYVYLVNLIKNGVFNTVFTTNFDDLLNEACYLYSCDTRPIVCAHDSSISSVRITSKRPKILKLHGDFLFDGIKNTLRELESLEKNTLEKFKQFASEYGFIVVGYQGNDRSIMDAFNMLLSFEQFFPHGIYWCVRKGTKISKRVDVLRRFPKFHIIEIDGFDDIFAEINDKMTLPLQEEILKPYDSLAKRLNAIACMSAPPRTENRIISRDIDLVQRNIKSVLDTSDSHCDDYKISIGKSTIPIPLGMLANLAIKSKEFDKAFEYIEKDIHQNPTQGKLRSAFSIMAEHNFLPPVDKFANIATNEALFPNIKQTDYLDIAIPFMKLKRFDLAQKFIHLWYENAPMEKQNPALRDINLALTFVLDDKNIPEELLEELQRHTQSTLPDYLQMGIAVVMKDAAKTNELIEKMTASDPLFIKKRKAQPIFDVARGLALSIENLELLKLEKPEA